MNRRPYIYRVTTASNGGWNYQGTGIDGEVTIAGWHKGTKAEVERYLQAKAKLVNHRHSLLAQSAAWRSRRKDSVDNVRE